MARITVANPFSNRELEAFPAYLAIRIATRAGNPHYVAYPAKLRILGLQEIVVRKFRFVVINDASGRQVELHPQSLRQRAVVEVLTVPAFALGECLSSCRKSEKQQKGDHVDFLRT